MNLSVITKEFAIRRSIETPFLKLYFYVNTQKDVKYYFSLKIIVSSPFSFSLRRISTVVFGFIFSSKRADARGFVTRLWIDLFKGLAPNNGSYPIFARYRRASLEISI